MATTFQTSTAELVDEPMHAAKDSSSLIEGQTEPKAKNRLKNFPKWQRTMVLWAILATIIFIFNLIFLVWSYLRVKTDDLLVPYTRNIYEGSCSRSRSINTGLHLLINILSTLLVAGSNYCMQCLLAPTRNEVTKAHFKKNWLDIGVLSLRNIKHISKRRASMWFLLGLSSLSLHLFFNSFVFESAGNADYRAFVVNESFGSIYTNNTDFVDTALKINNITYRNQTIKKEFDFIIAADATQLVNGPVQQLSALQCLDAYAQEFHSFGGDLFLVTANDTASANTDEPEVLCGTYVGDVLPVLDPYLWICSQFIQAGDHSPCDNHIASLRANISNWRPCHGQRVDYCLIVTAPLETQATSQPVFMDQCRVQADLSLGMIVGLINLTKMVILWIVVFTVKDQPLLTVGDAVQSFLEDPEPTTQGMCLLDKRDLYMSGVRNAFITSPSIIISGDWLTAPKRFNSTRKRRHTAVNKAQLLSLIALFCTIIFMGSFFLGYSVSHLEGPKDLISLWNLGLGPRARTLIDFPNWRTTSVGINALFQTVVLANIPQLMLSSFYLLYNGVLTSMLLAAEWDRYSVERKGLRVSTAKKGFKRNTYFLSLPYRYSVPLLVLSTLLHWLVSQSLFLVSIGMDVLYETRSSISGVSRSDSFTCGYSPIAIIFSIIVMVLMAIFAVFTAFKSFKSGMPVAGSSSAAISAACHPVLGSENTVNTDALLQWGVMGTSDEGIAHCGFSDREVEAPTDGVLYA